MDLDLFIEKGFKFIEVYEFNNKYKSYVFSCLDNIIIIDDNFDVETDENNAFNYSKYCLMQNEYIGTNKLLLRFNFEYDEDKLIDKILNIIENKEIKSPFDIGGSYSDAHIDNTPCEKSFEDDFIEAFGYDALECLQKEVAISNDKGRNYYIDYVVETKTGKFAFEQNGVRYHHPLIVGRKSYEELLDKQNMIGLLGYKLYRYSTENLAYSNRIIDNIKNVLPDKEEFIPKTILKNSRGLELYKHQTNILKQLDLDRLKGKNTALIVIPTASGKSEICISDLEKESIKKSCKRVLIMVPSIKVKEDWIKRIEPIKKYYEIDVMFYNNVFVNKNKYSQDYYDYIIFDEAHHAQATNCKACIWHFKPKYLIGLTATDERLDSKKLEEIFGTYEVKLTLKEAIDQDIVTNIRAFRLESNINLKEIRYNGIDFNVSDLEKNIIIDSRNELIADTLKKYFEPKDNFYKQGLVFCINIKHAKRVASWLKKKGLTAEAVYGNNSLNHKYFEDYKNKKIQFLCSCQTISEGWDSPQTEVVVMARPTLSKVLYTQQIGRGLRHYPNKECLYLIDVVDNYSAKLQPWNFNSLFHISTYSPFMGIKNNDINYLEVLGLNETEVSMHEIDIFTFEEKYKDYLSLEQAARELFVGTMTLNKWNKDKNYASLYLPIGNKEMPYFNQEDIDKIRIDKKLTIHTNETILQDFMDFIDENTLTFSFKLVFLINCFILADKEGDINLDQLIKEYQRFYLSRIKKGLVVDKTNCIYNENNLNDSIFVKKSILNNPFEKFERKRFLYYSKDLNIISFNTNLWTKLNNDIKNEIINKEMNFLFDYYKKYGGYDDEYQFLL